MIVLEGEEPSLARPQMVRLMSCGLNSADTCGAHDSTGTWAHENKGHLVRAHQCGFTGALKCMVG